MALSSAQLSKLEICASSLGSFLISYSRVRKLPLWTSVSFNSGPFFSAHCLCPSSRFTVLSDLLLQQPPHGSSPSRSGQLQYILSYLSEMHIWANHILFRAPYIASWWEEVQILCFFWALCFLLCIQSVRISPIFLSQPLFNVFS